MTYTELYEKLSTLKKEYTYYKYQVYNDIYHWLVVLGTTSEIGPIYHMDFSENLLQIHKFKPQSSLFSKAQYSLHCTVKHCSDSDTLTYQSKYVFSLLSSSAKKVSRKGILYYGVLGHSKGLVDTISAFRVKNPIRRAVWRESPNSKRRFFIQESCWHIQLLNTKLWSWHLKNYSILDKNEIGVCQSQKKSLKIKGCRSLHMIYFTSDGSMQTKINFCVCENCLIRDFIDCVVEKGVFIPAQWSNEFSDSESSEKDGSDDDGFNDDLDEME